MNYYNSLSIIGLSNKINPTKKKKKTKLYKK